MATEKSYRYALHYIIPVLHTNSTKYNRRRSCEDVGFLSRINGFRVIVTWNFKAIFLN